MLKWFMLLVYVVFSAYVVLRTIHCTKKLHGIFDHTWVHIVYAILFAALDSTLLFGEFLPLGNTRTMFHKFGNYWLGFFILLFTCTLVVDLVVLVLKKVNKKKEISFLKKKSSYALILIFVFLLSLSSTIYGVLHVNKFYINTYDVTVDKQGTNFKNLNVVMVGDLHLGYSIGKDHTHVMVEKINSLKPDIVIFAGDAFDNEFDVIEDPEGIVMELKQIVAPYGIYAVWGNHDVEETLVGGFPITDGEGACRDPRMEKFINDCGFYLLEDSTTIVNDSFYLIGRKDTERAGDGTKNRKTIDELVKGLDPNLPWIVINHEPDEFDETDEAGVDISLSGHTHAGQFFPLTVVQPFRWRNHWGYKKFGDLDTFVTSGVGVYGPPLRLGTDTEIMQIIMHFE